MEKGGVFLLFQPIKHFLFPPLCLHCDERVEEGRKLLCAACFQQLMPIDPEDRCPFCFVKKEEHPKRCAPSIPTAAVFENEGSVRALLSQFTHQSRFNLARALAPFFITQLGALKWPWPEVIVYPTQSLAERLVRGYNPSRLLATEVARLLSIPIAPPDSKKLTDKNTLLIACKPSPSLTITTALSHFPTTLRQLVGLGLQA